MQYAYGVLAKNESGIICPADGLLERLGDPTDSFWEIVIYNRQLGKEAEKKYGLVYLGVVEE